MTAAENYAADEDFDAALEIGEPIGDLERAEYVLGRYLYWQGRRDEVERAHTAAIERLDARRQRLDDWAAEEDLRLEKEQAWYGAQLEAFHRAALARDKKLISIPLPSGVLASHQGQPKVEILDEKAFLAAAPPNLVNTKVKTTVSPLKDAIKAHIKATGESLPGVKYIPASRKFEVKPS